MNGKKAKELRRLARMFTKHNPSMFRRVYKKLKQDYKKRKRLPN